jgi:DNA-binding transcriptional ArsR family regulator
MAEIHHGVRTVKAGAGSFKTKMSGEISLKRQGAKNVPQVDCRFDSIAFLAKSLSDENRLRILLCICKGKKSVSRIVEELELSQPLVSHHLKELKHALLVRVERNGPFIYYEIADQKIIDILKDLETLAKELLAQRNTF